MENILPDRFWRLFEDSLGSGNVRTFRDALAQPATVSIRRNPAKLPEDRFLSLFNASDGTDMVPWCHEGRYLNERPSFTLDPLLHCGAYYVQDSSSMFTGDLFSLLLNQCKDQKEIRILDLCAAPGGKTTHLASILRSSGRPDTLLVANEAVSSRVTSLAENVARWGEPNVVVTNSDPSEFIKLKNFFDIILVDAPCSGEGMFRKDEDSVKEWSEEVVRACATRQKHILIDAWPALKSGGFIIYSTCTYNRNENDSILEWIAAQLGADIIRPDNVPAGVHVTRAGGCQFIPGNIRGEGQYVCMLRKKGGMNSDASAKIVHAKKADDASCDYVLGDYKIIRKGDLLKAVPARLADEIATVEQNIRCVMSGIAVATVKGSDRIPEYDLAHCSPSMLNRDAFECVEVGNEEALRYLRRDALSFPAKSKGYLLLTYEDVTLGFVKNLGPRANNLMPISRRIRMQ